MTTVKPFNPRWRYTGDINLECGGTFYRPGTRDPFPECDYVEAVEVLGVADIARNGHLADNIFLVMTGSIYMPRDKYETALECLGCELVTGPRGALSIREYNGDEYPVNSRFGLATLVNGFKAYYGMDLDAMGGETVVRIGPIQDGAADEPEIEPFLDRPHEVYRADAKLENIVRRGFL